MLEQILVSTRCCTPCGLQSVFFSGAASVVGTGACPFLAVHESRCVAIDLLVGGSCINVFVHPTSNHCLTSSSTLQLLFRTEVDPGTDLVHAACQVRLSFAPRPNSMFSSGSHGKPRVSLESGFEPLPGWQDLPDFIAFFIFGSFQKSFAGDRRRVRSTALSHRGRTLPARVRRWRFVSFIFPFADAAIASV